LEDEAALESRLPQRRDTDTMTDSDLSSTLVSPEPDDRRLAGRVAIVTGAARGIGRAVERLVSDGADVVFSYSRPMTPRSSPARPSWSMAAGR